MKRILLKWKKQFVRWLLDGQIEKLESLKKECESLKKESLLLEQRLRNTVGSIDVAVDVHMKSPSWAVICIQGKKTDFVKFLDLGERDLNEIAYFLKRFERNDIRADLPHGMPKDIFLRI
jgi:hypothetical protein